MPQMRAGAVRSNKDLALARDLQRSTDMKVFLVFALILNLLCSFWNFGGVVLYDWGVLNMLIGFLNAIMVILIGLQLRDYY